MVHRKGCRHLINKLWTYKEVESNYLQEEHFCQIKTYLWMRQGHNKMAHKLYKKLVWCPKGVRAATTKEIIPWLLFQGSKTLSLMKVTALQKEIMKMFTRRPNIWQSIIKINTHLILVHSSTQSSRFILCVRPAK